jgi:3-dehydroquinate synthase
MKTETSVRVELGERSYDIVIGDSVFATLPGPLHRWAGAKRPQDLRVLLAADASIRGSYGQAVEDALRDAGADVVCVSVPSGETSKSLQQAEALYDALVEMQADRRTFVVAVGGGVTGDLAGFVAATYARGIPFVQMPTTLLAMVDSSVGGKTGINHPRGKNLIGAFHQPAAVFIDTSTLDTLPDRDYRSGLAEVVKYGVILDAKFFEWLEQHIDELNARDPQTLAFVVRRSCQLKADVVQADERETLGLRAVLNYGHTFAHAFETLAGYGSLLHGEAVAIGMVCASRLAESLQRIDKSVTDRQVALLSALGLPVDVPHDLRQQQDAIIERMMLDKKTQNRELRFILPAALGKVETVTGIDPPSAVASLC